ncbi:mercury transporter [Confluentibacter flavum]|uniref:Mercury transporter n=2 Tax=Confluentibacter flavum TaxID=1909700 RepID=A0A2N3HNC8_9FLAO|nr:mercury transporter [Confluentibacter flavum]
MAMILLLSVTSCNAQIKNSKTENVKIYGNCEMCESTIENAGNIKKVASVDWDKDTKMATLIYDSSKTNSDEILKRIALAGYDSDNFLAPDDAYAKLAECCQYDRVKKTAIVKTESMEDHAMHHQEMVNENVEIKQDEHPLKVVFDAYFILKDALVASDGTLTSAKAKTLLTAIDAVKMEKLTSESHTVWMKVMKDLALNTGHMEATKDISLQRTHFITLSDPMYQILKASKQDTSIYYQHCPMANNGKGANWLSKESAIKNPYYGAQMLTCGNTLETIE